MITAAKYGDGINHIPLAHVSNDIKSTDDSAEVHALAIEVWGGEVQYIECRFRTVMSAGFVRHQ